MTNFIKTLFIIMSFCNLRIALVFNQSKDGILRKRLIEFFFFAGVLFGLLAIHFPSTHYFALPLTISVVTCMVASVRLAKFLKNKHL